MRDDDSLLRGRVNHTVSLVLRGDIARVDRLEELARALPEPTPLRASVELARAVAYHARRRPEEATKSAGVLLTVAETTGEPGWAAVGHALLAVVKSRAGSDVESFVSLVEAEQALTATADAGLRCTAHHWLGVAYYVSRLYELAVPHARRTVELLVDHTGASAPPAPAHLFLASIHLRWAEGLELLGEPGLQPEIDRLHQQGSEAAQLAAQSATGADVDQRLVIHTEIMLAATQRTVAPRATLDRLTRLLVSLPSGRDDDRILILPQLALAHAELAELDQARAAARRGVDCLHEDIDLPCSITSQHVALRLDAQAGDAGARAGLQLARTLARGWWEQRLRDLHAIRGALKAQELAALHEVAYRAAREDPLTGVGNRRALEERFATTADGSPVAIVLMDLDRFKAVNDTLGHAAGDALLCRMADRVRECVRPEDLVARLGGDEFVVICHDHDGSAAARLVERLQLMFAPGWSGAPEAAACGLGVSLGHASTGEGLVVAELLPAADVRLYEDKRRASPEDHPDAPLWA